MTDQRWGQGQARGDVTDAGCLIEAYKDDSEPGGIADQPKEISQLHDGVIGILVGQNTGVCDFHKHINI